MTKPTPILRTTQPAVFAIDSHVSEPCISDKVFIVLKVWTVVFWTVTLFSLVEG
jgi:hypothetical protein